MCAFFITAGSFGNSRNIYAKDTPASKPSFSYGSKQLQTNWSIPYGPYPLGFYQIKDEALYYNWDADEFSCYASKASRTLSTENTSTIKVSAKASANFTAFVSAELGAEVGDTWTKKSSVTYDAKKGYNYVLWSANKINRQTYVYNSIISEKYSVDLKGGHKMWFFREKL